MDADEGVGGVVGGVDGGGDGGGGGVDVLVVVVMVGGCWVGSRAGVLRMWKVESVLIEYQRNCLGTLVQRKKGHDIAGHALTGANLDEKSQSEPDLLPFQNSTNRTALEENNIAMYTNSYPPWSPFVLPEIHRTEFRYPLSLHEAARHCHSV